MKAILEFSLPEDQPNFDLATQAGAMHSALWDIAQQVFRPARKHGYANLDIQKLLDKTDEVKVSVDGSEEIYGAGTEIVSQLEKMFYEILEEYNISLT